MTRPKNHRKHDAQAQLETRMSILEALLRPEHWSPNITKISKATGIPVSTVFDQLKKMSTVVKVRPVLGDE